MAKIAKEKKDEKSLSSEDVAAQLLSGHKEDHLNFEEEIFYKVSSGSFLFDKFLGGGFGPGLHRFGGEAPETGKTSASLEALRNHLNSPDYDGRGVYFKAEGRLSPEMIKRSGVTFVWKADEWITGTCLVIETNIFEFVLNCTSTLIRNNPSKVRYFFILDSMDTVGLRADIAKELEGDAKVAGVPKLFKQYCQKMANALAKLGHIFIITAQKSATISINPYGPSDKKLMEASGGNAISHQANLILEYQGRLKDDLILEHPEAKPDLFKNKIIGHRCRVKIRKSTNEKSGLTAYYYIRYGQEGGKSVWVEREMAEILIGSGLLNKGGAWFSFDEDFHKDITEKGMEVPVKLQGMDNVYALFENTPQLVEYVKDKFKNLTFDQIASLG